MKDIEILEKMRDDCYGQMHFEDDVDIYKLCEEEFHALNFAIKTIKDNYISKSVIKELITEIRKNAELAKECIKNNIVIADSDSLNWGRKEAHNADAFMLERLLEGEYGNTKI